MKNENSCMDIVTDIESNFIYFPHVKKILMALDRLRERQCGNGMARHIVLLGESGVGKSTLLTRYVEKHPRIVHEELTEVPVLFAELDQSPTPKRMVGTLLEALGDPKWDVGKEDKLTARLVFLIKRCRVRLVILDEANHLVDRGGEKTLHNSGDWIKLAGLPRTKRLFATNDQVRGRFREIISIDQFSVANKSAEHEFRSTLNVFKGYLRELPTIDLSGVAITRQFAFATDGRLREIQNLLARAVELAYELPDPRLTVTVLAEAFRTVIYPGSPDKRNPFHKAFNEMPLVKSDEPFAPVER